MAVTLKKQRKLTNREKANGIEPIIAREKEDPIWMGEYSDFFTGQLKPITQAFIDRLGKDLMQWCKEHPNAIRFDDFFVDKGIPRSTYYSWRDRFPFFKEQFEEAKRMIGRRRERGATFKDGDLHEGIIKSTMRQFLDEYKLDEIEIAALKKEEKDTEGTKYIVFEKVPETDVVKRRKVENE